MTPQRSFWERWLSFWFTPGDPTTMAFIRIITGALVVYVHLVYSLDLYSFFGEKAWYDLATANRERREMPLIVPSFDEWEHRETPKYAQLPDEKHRRDAVVKYLRSLPYDKKDELNGILRFLDVEADLKDEVQRLNTSLNAQEANRRRAEYNQLIFNLLPMCGLKQPPNARIPLLSRNETVRRNIIQSMINKELRSKDQDFPAGLDSLPEEVRAAKAVQLEQFYLSLPEINYSEKDPAKLKAQTDEYTWVLEYFQELGWILPDNYIRNNLLRFIREVAKLSPEEREKRIEYLAYWNTEAKFATRIGYPTFSIWYHITNPTEMVIAHIFTIIIMVMFAVGYHTRITSVLTWLLATSYLHRNPQVLFGQDTMMNILLIYLMIANSGAALSVDRWLACRKARKLSLAKNGTIDAATAAYLAAPLPSLSSAFAQRMLQVHFCFIYMAAGLSKLKGNAWWNHNAFWDTLVNPEFTWVHFQWYEQLVRWITASRPIYAAMSAGGVWFTLFIEISLPFLVWTRLRPHAVILALLLHFGVGVFMGLLVFSLLMMTMLLCYLPGSVIRGTLFSKSK